MWNHSRADSTLPQCLVGSKVDAISTALTWVHNHAHLSLPTVSPSILLLSPNRTEDLTASLTNPESSISAPSIADKMINAYKRSLEQQRMGFFVAIGIWALVFLMGVFGAWWRAVGEDRWRKWRGRAAVPEHDDREPDAEKATFRPLHLRAWLPVGREKDREIEPQSVPVPLNDLPPPSFLVEPATPATLSDRSASPSSRSWASLVDFFRQEDGAPATSGPPSHSRPVLGESSPPLKPLALPLLPKSFHQRSDAPPDRLRPVISQPRPLLRPFRVLREAHSAQQQRRRDRRRESDLILLRDETRAKSGPASFSSRGPRPGTRTNGEHQRDEVDCLGDHDDPFSPTATATPPPYASRPRNRQSMTYIPSSRPLAATNPFATPFDE